MAEVDIQVKIASAKTIAEIERLKKELTSVYKATTLGTKDNEAAAKALVQVKEQLARTSDKVATANGKLMKSYFNLGEEYRRYLKEQRLGNKAMSDASQTVQNFTNILGGTEISNAFNSVINNFQTTETTINAMGLAAQSAGGKMASLGKSVISMGAAAIGPLAALVTEAMILNGLLDKSREIAERFEGARIKKGKTNKREQDIKKLKNVKSLTFGVESGFLGDILGSGASGLGTMLRGIKTLDLASLREDIEGDIQPGEYLGGGVSTVGTVLGEVTSTGKQKTPKDEGINRYYSSEYFKNKYRDREAIGTLGGLGVSRKDWTPGQIKMGVESLDTVQTKVDGINQNVLSIGNALANSLTQGFMRGFETGDSMLKTFGESVLAAIMGIAAQQTAIAGISGILSLIPGVGSFSAIAGAMGSIFANTSTSPTAGVDVTAGKGGVVQELRAVRGAVQSLDLRVDNMGIHMAAERGRVAFERS